MIERLNSIVWGKGTVFLLLITGILYTIRLKGIQFRLFPYIFRKMRNPTNLSSKLDTFCMSLGAAMGTGNITGVAYAVKTGGAGAVFWMWISAFTGMAVVYAENALSVKYNGKNVHGAMAYIKNGVGSNALAIFFAVCCIIAAFGMGGMVQVSVVSESMRECTEFPAIILFILAFIVIYLAICKGSQRISRISRLLLPLATITYFIICLFAVFHFRNRIGEVFLSIFRAAFGLKPVIGGTTGYALSKAVTEGIKRGIFSNEAGLGSSPILHSSAVDTSHETLCMSAMLEVFTDTILCCTITAVTVLCSPDATTISSSFFTVTGKYTDIILLSITAVFALCTVIGWSYCGLEAFIFIFGEHGKSFTLIFSLISASGAVIHSETVWQISDLFNGMMIFPNIFALLFLFREVKEE